MNRGRGRAQAADIRTAIRAIACGLSLGLAGCGGGGGAGTVAAQSFGPGPTPTPFPQGLIQHVVIIVQENRSTDNMFNGFPGADTATTGNDHGSIVQLQPVPLEVGNDYTHSHGTFMASYDGGKMDRFPAGIRGDSAYVYVPAAETAPLRQLAQQYVFADRMFQTNEGPSFPAHQFVFSATSKPSDGSDLLASENPGDKTHTTPLGCGSVPDMRVPLIDPNGSERNQAYPCFEHETLTDLLEGRGITWTYYTPQVGGFWDGPSSIQHIFDNPAEEARVVTPETQIFADISSGNLAGVSWVIPNGLNSDHPGVHTNTGPSWVASIVDAIGTSQYWNTTAIFVTWDDWGGVYDHVAPPIKGSYSYGFRVPLIVVSPYAKSGYVSHQPHDFGSIIHFVEDAWGLGTLGFADERADDLSDCFDFSQSPRPFAVVHSEYSRSYFLTARRRFVAPDDN